MGNKHTPGPWSVPHFAEPEVGCKCGYVLSDTCMGAVATVHCSGEGDWKITGDNPKFEEACANARLIAAAPELLEALREAEVGLEFAGADKTIAEGDFIPTPTLALRAVRAAIAKATGEQS